MVFKVNRGKMDFFSDKKEKDKRTGSYWSEWGVWQRPDRSWFLITCRVIRTVHIWPNRLRIRSPLEKTNSMLRIPKFPILMICRNLYKSRKNLLSSCKFYMWLALSWSAVWRLLHPARSAVGMVEFSRLQLTSSGNLTLKKKCLPGSNPPSWPGLWVTLLKLTCSRAYASKQSQDQTGNKPSLAQRVWKWSKVKTSSNEQANSALFMGLVSEKW